MTGVRGLLLHILLGRAWLALLNQQPPACLQTPGMTHDMCIFHYSLLQLPRLRKWGLLQGTAARHAGAIGLQQLSCRAA